MTQIIPLLKNTFKVTVEEGFKNTSSVSAEKIMLDKTLDITCSSSGAKGECTYAVFYKKTADTAWKTKQNFSANKNVSVKFSETGDYNICVKVKDTATGKQYKKTNTNISIVPAQSGIYNVCIKVYDETDTVVKKYIDINVLEAN